MSEVRIRQHPVRFAGKQWETEPQSIVKVGEVGKWVLVRRKEYPQAVPFVMSLKEWAKLEIASPGERVG